MQMCYLVLMKSSDKLIYYFRPRPLKKTISENGESCSAYSQFCKLPDIMIKVDSFDDFFKIRTSLLNLLKTTSSTDLPYRESGSLMS